MKTFLQNKLRNILGVELKRVDPITNPKTLQTRLNVGSVQRSIYFYDLFGKIKNITGDVVECGAGLWRSLLLLLICEDLYDNKRHIYCFDSFQRLPELSKYDVLTSGHVAIKGKGFNLRSLSYQAKEDVIIQHLIKSGISQEFISNHITFVKGFFVRRWADIQEHALLYCIWMLTCTNRIRSAWKSFIRRLLKEVLSRLMSIKRQQDFMGV